jgi:ATP-dependent RNA helicase DeaD
MTIEDLVDFDDFSRALRARGFTELTDVQQAVLSPELAGRDLRISSQTGSGKTVALGFVVAGAFTEKEGEATAPDAPGESKGRAALPRVLVVVPTRELAAQLGEELSWLYGQRRIGLTVVTGGTSVEGDLRALRDRPGMVIGTPGRLVDHLDRGSLGLAGVAEVVLDEADEMLDMGFREELESILGRTPETRRTHLVSATFPPKVRSLANRYQRNAVLVEGKVGAQHQDISHSCVVVAAHQRTDALVNLMLLQPEQRFLVFVRTRLAASGIAGELSNLGLSAGPLSGEMVQRERTRCLADFRAHKLQCVVATDVAARGLDIRGVEKVVHYDLPESREAFTHRSGRTGRAGEKGESIILVPPASRRRVEELFRILELEVSWRSPPTPAKIRKAGRKRLVRKYGAFEEASATDADVGEGAEDKAKSSPAQTSRAPEEYLRIAERLLERRPPEALVAELLHEVDSIGQVAAREIQEVPQQRAPRPHRGAPGRGAPSRGAPGGRGRGSESGYVPFEVSWGSRTGATPPRMLAHACRRGGIHGKQVGAINIEAFRSVINIAADVAEKFEKAVARPDPQNPKVRFRKAV